MAVDITQLSEANAMDFCIPFWINPKNHIEMASYIISYITNVQDETGLRHKVKRYFKILNSKPNRKKQCMEYRIIFAKTLVNKGLELSDIRKFFSNDISMNVLRHMKDNTLESFKTHKLDREKYENMAILPGTVSVVSVGQESRFMITGNTTGSANLRLGSLFNETSLSDNVPFLQFSKFQKQRDDFVIPFGFKFTQSFLSTKSSKIIRGLYSIGTTKGKRYITIDTGSGFEKMSRIIDCAFPGFRKSDESDSYEQQMRQGIIKWDEYVTDLFYMEIRTVGQEFVLDIVAKPETEFANSETILKSLFGEKVEITNIKNHRIQLKSVYPSLGLNSDVFLDIVLNDPIFKNRGENILYIGDERKSAHFAGAYPKEIKGSFVLYSANNLSKKKWSKISVNQRPGTKKTGNLPYIETLIRAKNFGEAYYLSSLFNLALDEYTKKAISLQKAYAAAGIDVIIPPIESQDCEEMVGSKSKCEERGCGPPSPMGKCTINVNSTAWSRDNYARSCQNHDGVSRVPLVVSNLEDFHKGYEVNKVERSYTYGEFPKESGQYLVCPNATNRKSLNYPYLSFTPGRKNKEFPLLPCCVMEDSRISPSEGYNRYYANLTHLNLKTNNYIQFSGIKGDAVGLIKQLQGMGFSLIGYALVKKDDGEELYLLKQETKRKKGKGKIPLEHEERIPLDILSPPEKAFGAFLLIKDGEEWDLKIFLEQDAFSNEESTVKWLSESLNKYNWTSISKSYHDPKKNADLKSEKVAPYGRRGKLPNAIERFLSLAMMRYGSSQEQSTDEWLRIGVGEDPSVSLINCVIAAERSQFEAGKTSQDARNYLWRRVEKYGVDRSISLLCPSMGVMSHKDFRNFIFHEDIDPLSVHALIQSLFEMNIVMINRDFFESPLPRFVLPYHGSVFVPQRPYGRTIIIYIHAGRDSDRFVSENTCELVINSGAVFFGDFASYVRKAWLNTEESFRKTDLSFQHISNSGGQNLREFGDDWSQLINDTGEAIGLKYQDRVNFYTKEPLPPIILPISNPSPSQSEMEILTVINEVNGIVKLQNPTVIHSVINGVTFESPIITGDVDQIYKFQVNQRIAKCLKGYALYLFSLACKTKKGILKDLTKFLMFEKSQEEPPIDLYDDKLPPLPELLSGCNLLIFDSFGDFDEIVNRLKFYISLALDDSEKNVLSYHTLGSIPDYFDSVSAFDSHPGEIVKMLDCSSIKRDRDCRALGCVVGRNGCTEFEERLFDGKLYQFPLFNTIQTVPSGSPYYLKNAHVTGNKICLCLTVDSDLQGQVKLQDWIRKVIKNSEYTLPEEIDEINEYRFNGDASETVVWFDSQSKILGLIPRD